MMKQNKSEQLAGAACERFPRDGLEFAEGYPVKKLPSPAWNFPGPL